MPNHQVHYSHRRSNFTEFLLLVLKACAELNWHITYISDSLLKVQTKAVFSGAAAGSEVSVEKVTEQLVSIQCSQSSTALITFGRSRNYIHDLIDKTIEIAARPESGKTGTVDNGVE